MFAAQTGSESGPSLAKLVDALPAPGIGIDLDPGNLILNGFSPLEAVTALGPRILNVHAHDGVRDLARGRGIEVPLGRGSADFPALLAALEEQPYRGFFTVVCVGEGEPQTEISQAISYLRSL
jgi:sugar phosphate isomerase/epimerase